MTAQRGDLLICSWGDTIEAHEIQTHSGRQIVGDIPEWNLSTEESIRQNFSRWRKEHELFGIIWRQERWLVEFAELEANARKRPILDTIRNVDDAQIATSAARDVGLPVYCYFNAYDEGMPPHVPNYTHREYDWESRFFTKNSDYYACDRNWQKKHWGVPEYAYPEVREYKCQELSYFLDNYTWDGVYISTRGHRMPAEHGDQYGFNRPVVDAYRERFGVDILTENFDLEAWRRLRGEFLTQYFRDVRRIVNDRGLKLIVGVPPGDYFGPPIGNLFLDWRTWISEKIVDGLIVGHANVVEPEHVGKHLQMGYGYLTSFHHGEWGLPPLPELLEKEYGPLCNEHDTGLWASLTIRQRLADLYGKVYTNETLRAIPNLSGLQWEVYGLGDEMLHLK